MRRKKVFADEGYSSPFVLAVIFYISFITMAASLMVCAVRTRIASIGHQYDSDGKAFSLFSQFLEDMQGMVEEKGDSPFSSGYLSLLDKYQNCSIDMKDISTGINPSTMGKILDSNMRIMDLIDVYGKDIEKEYGWINPTIANTDQVISVLDDFELSNVEDLFPLANVLPVCNVHFMQEEFIEAILESYKIPNYSMKARKLFMEAAKSVLDENRIKEIVDVDDSASVLNFIGSRTSFWSIHLETDDRNIDSVVAAVPFREEKTRDVEKYISLKRRVTPRRLVHG